MIDGEAQYLRHTMCCEHRSHCSTALFKSAVGNDLGALRVAHGEGVAERIMSGERVEKAMRQAGRGSGQCALRIRLAYVIMRLARPPLHGRVATERGLLTVGRPSLALELLGGVVVALAAGAERDGTASDL